MTVIATCLSEQGFCAISDILVTDDSLDDGYRDLLPLQFGLRTTSSRTTGRRAVSKGVLFEECLLLWSGTLVFAEMAIRIFKENPPPLYDREAFSQNILAIQQEALARYPERRYDLAIIFCRHAGNQWIWEIGDCDESNFGDYKGFVGGTGSEDYRRFVSARTDPHLNVNPATLIISFLVQAIARELTDISHAYDAYGGGYEVFLPNENDVGFRRCCYSILEVSDRDHVSGYKLGYLMDSRSIKAYPLTNGTLFVAFIIANPDTGAKGRFAFFRISELGTDGQGEIVREECDFGIAYVINSKLYITSSSQPFTDFSVQHVRQDTGFHSVNFEYVQHRDKLNELVRVHNENNFPNGKKNIDGTFAAFCQGCKSLHREVITSVAIDEATG